MSAIPTTNRSLSNSTSAVENPLVDAQQRTATRPRVVRFVALAGFFAALAALTPMASAFADEGSSSPSAPIVRSADRGVPMVGTGGVRQATQVADAHGTYVAIQGGNTSAGAPIKINDGNRPSMPTITGENGVICSSGQNVHSAMIPCFG